MKNENDTNGQRAAVANDDLLAALRNGELEYNQEDVENVLKAYVNCKMFDDAMNGAGLGYLPDPDDEHAKELSDLEDWMVGAFQEIDRIRGIDVRSEDKCRDDLADLVTEFSSANSKDEEPL